MRRKLTADQSKRLTGWADDHVTKQERRILGDDAAAVLAQERQRQQQRRRRPFVLTEGDVSPTRPEVPQQRHDETALEVMAQRQHLLSDRPGLPWRDDR